MVEKVEAARRLQTNIEARRVAQQQARDLQLELDRVARVKAFLKNTCAIYATAESESASRRLKAIEPAAQSIFKSIMGHDVVPALIKREGTEELSLSLAEFWTLEGLSAQALLSESYRNALAISVYLAAASL